MLDINGLYPHYLTKNFNEAMLKPIFVLGFVLVFCGINAEISNASDTFPPKKSAIINAIGTLITGKLTGGPNAGSFSAKSINPTCSMGLTGAKSFGNQYSVSGKGDNDFSSLQLIVDDYDAAKKGTEKFYLKVAFGKRLLGKKYEINNSSNSLTGKKQGTGKLTIKENGAIKTVTITGKTKDGIEIVTTIVCNSIITSHGK